MKTQTNRILFVILCIIIASITYCNAQQDYDKTNNISLISAPGTYIDFGHENYTDDGFNIGLRYAYRNPIVYVGGELLVFPKLNNYDYSHLILRAGLNFTLLKTQFEEPIIRIHFGFRGGAILREIPNDGNKMYQLRGLEGGLTFDIPNTALFLTIDWAKDTKTDSKGFDPSEDNHKVDSVFAGVGLRF